MEKEHDQIINKVAASALVTFDLEQYFQPGERILFDIKDQLFQGLIIREKDFREFTRNHNWAQYQDKFVAICCSADAIVPTWAYMLLAISLQPFARRVMFGTLDDLEITLFQERLAGVNWSQFKGAKVVIKGCSKVNVPVAVYVEATNKLMPHASSLMFGEPCSTVPLFKKRKL
ncbi:MAG: DUF2480 family protein [Cyclobacteriaceae bacterium]|jgi:hypothetical protein|nr:DUF2480 family protein [Cyclobacteriaceae bacterium]MDH4298322.1 DUF2480 family protein [Cyclobacteriaceae bacterium]MDH5251439.1 DUF2480 family protein [Cyclobacteriaceae bacterium]